jgi:hypothetical protein
VSSIGHGTRKMKSFGNTGRGRGHLLVFLDGTHSQEQKLSRETVIKRGFQSQCWKVIMMQGEAKGEEGEISPTKVLANSMGARMTLECCPKSCCNVDQSLGMWAAPKRRHDLGRSSSFLPRQSTK